MNRSCGVTDRDLLAFASGDRDDLGEHVEGCEECQAELEAIWSEAVESDITEPVMRVVRLEKLVVDVVRATGGILADMGRALMKYAVRERQGT